MFSIIIKETKLFLRNRSNVFWVIFFPTILVFVLGTMLENINRSESSIGEINLGYYAVTSSQQTNNFYKSLEKQGILKLKKFTDLSNAKKEVNDGNIAGIAQVDGENIKLFLGSNSIKNRSLIAMTQGFLHINNTYAACAESIKNPLDLMTIKPANQSYTKPKDFGIKRSMIDYYAISMIVMMIFMGCIMTGINCFSEERRLTTNIRINISSQNSIAIFLGKVFGNLPLVLIQISTVMILTPLLFGANYCAKATDNIILIVMFICASLAAISVGVLFGLIVKKSITVIWQVLAWTLCFLSGTFAKPIYVEGVTNICPPYIIQQASFDLTLFGKNQSSIKVIISSLIIFVLTTIVGALIYVKRRQKNV